MPTERGSIPRDRYCMYNKVYIISIKAFAEILQVLFYEIRQKEDIY